jgi:hypothetical protein
MGSVPHIKYIDLPKGLPQGNISLVVNFMPLDSGWGNNLV